jgi:rhodanese-related sulfurtransferase
MNRVESGPYRVVLLAAAVLLCLAGGPAAGALKPPLEAPQLRALLGQEGGEVFLLDVRTRREWAGGRIPGSVWIPMNDVPARLADIPARSKVVVVCASGVRSAAVARYLDQMGYPWVANYPGGVVDWSRRGLPLER